MRKERMILFIALCLLVVATILISISKVPLPVSLERFINKERFKERGNETNFNCTYEFSLDANVKNNQNTKVLEECKGLFLRFPSSLRVNMNYVSTYKFNVSRLLLQQLKLDNEGIEYLSKKTYNKSKFPTFVTGLSDNHYGEFWGALRTINNLKRKYPELNLIVYNLGLSMKNTIAIREKCNCSIRKFPFEIYPQHVRHLQGFAWKPIIIQTVLQESDFVLWMDTSIRLNNTDLYFLKAQQYGIQILKGDGSIAVRTHRQMFNALEENPCMFNYPETQGGLVLISRTCLTLTYIMRPWVSCALQYGCMDFPNANKYYGCSSDWKLSSCHRSDQSVIGIILTRLFNNRRHQIELGREFATVCRGCH